MRNICGHCASTWPCTATFPPKKTKQKNTQHSRIRVRQQRSEPHNRLRDDDPKNKIECQVRHAHTRMYAIVNAPMPASAICSQSSARPSSRRRKSALARCSASTASNSFFLSASRARRAALGGAGADCEPGAWEARDEATDDGRMRLEFGRCLLCCLLWVWGV